MPTKRYKVAPPTIFHCELCNKTDAPFPQILTKHTNMLKFEKIVMEYTKTPPCVACRALYAASCVKHAAKGNIPQPDKWILQRLITRYDAAPSRKEKKNSLLARKKRNEYHKKQRAIPEKLEKERLRRIEKSNTPQAKKRKKFTDKYKHKRKQNAKNIKTNIEYFKTKLIQSNGSYYEWDYGTASCNTEYQGCCTNNMFFANRPRTKTFRIRLGTKAI